MRCSSPLVASPVAAGMDEPAAKAWLEGEYGDPPRALPETMQKNLLQGFKDGVWDESDVMDGTGTASDARDLWLAIAEDTYKKASTAFGKADSVRLTRWIEGHFEEGDVGDETWERYVPSTAEKKDLEAQGMSSGRELRRLESATFLGLAPNDDGIAGGVYRGLPNAMLDAKLAFKQKHDTIQSEIEKCRAAGGDLTRLERFFTMLVADLADSDDLSDQRQSARVGRFWSEAKRNLPNRPFAVLTYLEEYRAHYRGRGLPVDYDSTIGQRAWHQSESPATLGSTLPGGPGSSGGGTAMGSSSLSGYSQLPPSASEAGGSSSVAMAEQMKELMTSVRALSTTVQGLSSRVSEIGAHGGNPDANMTCGRCGQKGHRAKNCPSKKDKKTEEEDK